MQRGACAEIPVVVIVGPRHGWDVVGGRVRVEIAGQPERTPARSPGGSQAELPARRGAERIPGDHRIERLQAVLHALPRGLDHEAAAAGAQQTVGVIEIDAAIVRRPARGNGSHGGFGKALDADRAGARGFGVDEDDARRGPGAIQRRRGRQ